MNPHLSAATALYGFYLVVSASYMYQIRGWLLRTLGLSLTMIAFKFFLVILIGISWVYVIRRGLSRRRALLLLLNWLVVLWLVASQPFFSERTHVITYGILGVLAFRDLSKISQRRSRAGLLTVLLVIFVGLSDETFQGILPYRVFDVRDILTNTLSGMMGSLFYAVIQSPKGLEQKRDLRDNESKRGPHENS